MENNIRIMFDNFIVEDELLYFTEYRFNCFCIYDLIKKSIIFTAFLDDEPERRDRLFASIIHYKNFVYLIPFIAGKIYKINLENNTIKGIDLQNDIFEKSGNHSIYGGKFLSAHCYENKIYMFPAMFPAVAILDAENDKIDYFDDWVNQLSENGKNKEKGFFRKTKIINGMIYAPCIRTNKLLKMNPSNCNYDILTISNDGEGFSSICTDGQSLFLLSRLGSTLTVWDERKGNTNTYKGNWPSKTYAADIVCLRDRILCFPLTREGVLNFHEQKFGTEKLDFDKAGYEMQANYKFGDLYVSCFTEGCLYHFFNDSTATKIELFFNDTLMERYGFFFSTFYRKVKYENDSMILESKDNGLKEYIRLLDS